MGSDYLLIIPITTTTTKKQSNVSSVKVRLTSALFYGQRHTKSGMALYVSLWPLCCILNLNRTEQNIQCITHVQINNSLIKWIHICEQNDNKSMCKINIFTLSRMKAITEMIHGTFLWNGNWSTYSLTGVVFNFRLILGSAMECMIL